MVISGGINCLPGWNNIKRVKWKSSTGLCPDKCVISPVWHFKSEPQSLSCLSRFCTDLHPCFPRTQIPREASANAAVAKVRVLTIILSSWNIIRSESHFSAHCCQFRSNNFKNCILVWWICILCQYCFKWKWLQRFLHLFIVSVKWNPDKPALWCLRLQGSGLNETILHCLSTIYRGWQNTRLILTEVCLLSLVSRAAGTFCFPQELQALAHKAKQLSGPSII